MIRKLAIYLPIPTNKWVFTTTVPYKADSKMRIVDSSLGIEYIKMDWAFRIYNTNRTTYGSYYMEGAVGDYLIQPPYPNDYIIVSKESFNNRHFRLTSQSKKMQLKRKPGATSEDLRKNKLFLTQVVRDLRSNIPTTTPLPAPALPSTTGAPSAPSPTPTTGGGAGGGGY